MRFILTGGNASDARLAIPLMTDMGAGHVIADKAYDAHAILDHIEASGAQPIIPQRTCMPRKRAFDPIKYKLPCYTGNTRAAFDRVTMPVPAANAPYSRDFPRRILELGFPLPVFPLFRSVQRRRGIVATALAALGRVDKACGKTVQARLDDVGGALRPIGGFKSLEGRGLQPHPLMRAKNFRA